MVNQSNCSNHNVQERSRCSCANTYRPGSVVIRAITAAAVITIVTVAVSDLVRHVHAHQDHAHHAHVHLDLVHHVHALHVQVVKTAVVHNIVSV
mgnify:CR=1 FL=1